MWQKENSEEKKIIPEDLQTRYDKILKKPVKDNNIYLYLQIFFMAVMSSICVKYLVIMM